MKTVSNLVFTDDNGVRQLDISAIGSSSKVLVGNDGPGAGTITSPKYTSVAPASANSNQAVLGSGAGKDIVNAISTSGSGLPTEKAVADAAYWIEVGRFTARQSGSGNKYDFIALKNAGYKYARVRENRTGGYCGADIDLSKVTMSTQIRLISTAFFWSSSRIDIISITQDSADVTSRDFIFYKVSITISESSATYTLKNSGQTETLIVEARK